MSGNACQFCGTGTMPCSSHVCYDAGVASERDRWEALIAAISSTTWTQMGWCPPPIHADACKDALAAWLTQQLKASSEAREDVI